MKGSRPSSNAGNRRIITTSGGDHPSDFTIGSAASAGQRSCVLRPHAQGGLGAIAVALDLELNREVALKQILDHHAADSVSRQRFHRWAM